MVKKCKINNSSHFIEGNIPKNIEPLIDLYNTWVAYFMKEYWDGIAMRYQQSSGSFLFSDTIEVGKELLKYCNDSDNSVTIGMLKLIDIIEDSRQFSNGFYNKPKRVREEKFDKDGEILFGENIEFSFKRIEELVKHESMHTTFIKELKGHNAMFFH